MDKKYSLQKIIQDTLNIKDENNLRRIRRRFDTFLERLKIDKNLLKSRSGEIEFEESALPFMKVLISQLYKSEGVVAEFVSERNKNKTFSADDVIELKESLVNEAKKAEMNEDELKYLDQFFNDFFFISPARSINFCHMLIDALAINLQSLTSSQKAVYLTKFEHILKKEFALSIAESAMIIEGIAEEIEMSKKEAGDDIGIQSYHPFEVEIRNEYMQRDRAVLEAIQGDDDLRQYIEKKFGKKAEEIFNYAALDM